MALIGDTVRLSVEFKDFNNNYIDPTSITLNVYDVSKNIVNKDIPIGAECKSDVGKYIYPYTIPDGKKNLVYEFVGQVNGYQVVGRGILPREWVKGMQ